MKINVCKLNELARIPTRGSEVAAGYDLYPAISYPITIPPHSTMKIGTGLAFELDVNDNLFGAIFARSGLATKHGIRPANCVAVCDADYRGEYIVPLYNDSDLPFTIHPGDRIAQLVFLPFYPALFNEIDKEQLTSTERGDGGFGHTGR